MQQKYCLIDIIGSYFIGILMGVSCILLLLGVTDFLSLILSCIGVVLIGLYFSISTANASSEFNSIKWK